MVDVLYATAGGLTAWSGNGRSLRVEARFAATADGITAFDDWLRCHADSEFRLLADLADEEFEFEDIPPVRGRDRRELIERKLDQIYFGTPFKTAISCGRRRDGRRDECMLFAALARPQALALWLEALQRADAAIDSIVSAAQLIERLPSVHDRRLPCRLVVAATPAGLRQTFLEDGRLRFSRLTPSVAEADAPAACGAEAARFRQYLAGRLLDDDAKLSVLIVADTDSAARYRAHCEDSPGLRFEYVDLDEESRRAGLNEMASETGVEALLVRLLMHRRPAEQFAPANLRRTFVVRRADRNLYRGAWLSLAAGLLAGGLQLAEARHLRQETAALATSSGADARDLEVRLRALPPAPLPAAELRALLDRYNGLRRSPKPADAYRRLGEALTGSSQIVLERLDWKHDATTGEVVVDLHASLPSALATEPRAQLAVVDEFAQRLRTVPTTRVQPLAPPFDADPGKALTSQAVAATERPKFSLRIVQAAP